MKLEDIKTSLNTTMRDHANRGIIDDYEFQVTHVKQLGMTNYYMSFLLNQSLTFTQTKEINKLLGIGNAAFFSSAIFPNNIVSIFIRKPEKSIQNAKKVVEYLKSNQIESLTTEIYGSLEEVDTYKVLNIPINENMNNLKLNGLTIPINQIIYNQKHSEKLSEIEKLESNNDNLLKGIAFAILGALIGAVPSVIVYYSGFMSWFLYLIIPLMAFYLYKKANGPLQGYVPIIIGVISIIVGLGSLLIIFTDIILSNNLTIDMVLSDNKLLASFVSDLIFSLIGNIVGFILSYRIIYSKSNAAKRKALDELK